jgi:ribosomal protein L16 Arg81 hydroxylase
MLELLLAREEELTQREEALTTREEKAGILEKALAKVSADLAAERAKAEATRKVYLEKMAAHTARAKHSLGLDKMLGEKKVELNGKERDLVLREAVLAEAQTRGLNPQDNLDDLMESIELWRLLQDAEAYRVIDVGRPW